MKKFFFVAVAWVSIIILSCEKYKNAMPDLQNTVPSYVQVKDRDKENNALERTVKKSAAYRIILTTFYAFNEDITINYELKGVATTQGNAVLAKGTRADTINLVAPSTPQTIMFSVTGTSSPKLTVGKIAPSSEVVKITVTD